MGKSIIDLFFRNTFKKISTFSHSETELTLKRIEVGFLEFEDVLFHHNSAVMMPENPKGTSSSKDVKDPGIAAEQTAVTGVKAISLIYKELEFDPKKRILIAGHTDTTGGDEYNFELSKLRALNVQHLITGDRDEWVKVCYEKHKVEDYQQILTYYSGRYDSDPLGIDDTWGKNSKTATEHFIKNYNEKFVPGAAETGIKPLPDGLVAKIENDDKKRWPKELWGAFFNLYSNDIREIMGVSWTEFDVTRSGMQGMFAYEKRKYIACGESFPIAAEEKDNYRSQENRRVEILFFDQKELLPIEIFKPCAQTKVKHTDKECPIWCKKHIKPVYLDSKKLYEVVYHLNFKYFDRAANKLQNVPAGLTIKAYENDTVALPTDSNYSEGVYYVKVRFTKSLGDPSHKKLHFEFETTNSWIFTENSTAAAVMAVKTAAEIKVLAFKDRLKYYDLPAKWSSRNYWTRYDGDFKKGDRFEKVFKEIKTLKPLGGSKTSPTSPLVFSLDDLVLTDSRSQVIADKDATGAGKALDANSRYALFYIDDTAAPGDYKEITSYKNDKGKIKLHKQDPDEPVFTKGKYEENLLTDVPGHTRIVYFCNGFYDVFDKRSLSSDTGFDFAKKHVAGARMALLNDAEIHVMKIVRSANASDLANAYAQDNCGNYEMHYFHACGLLDDKMLAYQFIYWSGRLKANLGGTAADVTNHRKEGMTNAMKRLNKDVYFVKSSGPAEIDHCIRPFHYIEAKNDTNGGKEQALIDITDDNGGAWMLPTTSKLRSRDYQDDPTYFGPGDPDNALKDTNGDTFSVLTNHHEFGHATGSFDCYLYDFIRNKNGGGGHADWRDDETNWNNLPRYHQPYTAVGGPYSYDKLARMNINRAPRLRDLWKFVCWLHDEAAVGKSLNTFLQAAKFKITFKATGFTHNFELKPEYKNIERAAKFEDNHQLPADAPPPGTPAADPRADLYLYKLGDDELSHFKNIGNMHSGFETTQVYKGILVVKTKIAFRFRDVVGGAWPSFNDAHSWMDDFNTTMKSMLNGKFKLTTASAAHDFSTIYVQFVPHYEVYATGVPAASHFNVEVAFQLGHAFSMNGKTLTVDWDTDKKMIIRYCLGKLSGASDLTKADLTGISTWASSATVCNAAYTIKDI